MTETWTLEELHRYQATGEEPGRAPTPHKPPKLDRYKSDTERRFATLLAAWHPHGQITRWWYEPCKGFFLAPDLSYTPDFLLALAPDPPWDWPAPWGDLPPGMLVFVEVKGAHIYTKDWQRAKQAAALYPCFRFLLAQWKEQRWTWKEIPAL